MLKRAAAFFAAALMLVLSAVPASAEQTLRKGDTVRYIFSVGECENVAGIAVDSFYNAELLELSEEPEFLFDGQGMTNTSIEGRVKWNVMISGGRGFNAEEVLAETFTVKKRCTLTEAALSFKCTEIFGSDMTMLPKELVSADVKILETGTDDDEPEESDTESDSDTQTDSASQAEESSKTEPRPTPSETSSLRRIEIISTEYTSTEDDFESDEETQPSQRPSARTVSNAPKSSSSKTSAQSANSSAAESSSKTSEAASKRENTDTQREQGSGKTSSTADTSKASFAAESLAASSSQQTVSHEPSQPSGSSASPAGRVIIAAAAAAAAAAGAVFVLAKNIKTTD